MSAYAAAKQTELERQMADYREYRKEKRRLEEAVRRQVQWATRTHNEKPDRTAPSTQAEFNRGQAQAHMRRAKAIRNRLDQMRVEKPREAARINLKMDGAGCRTGCCR